MNICMVSRDFLPNIGGIATHVYELSKALVSLGHEVHVVKSSYGSDVDSIERVDGIRVHRIYGNRKLGNFSALNLILKTNRYINPLALKENIEIIHWHQLLNSSLETKLVNHKIRKIFTNHSSDYLRIVQRGLGRQYLRWLLKHASAIIAPSCELTEKSKILRKRIYYIPNGVDSERFRPIECREEIREKYNIAPHEFVILCARRLDPKNGVEFLIRAAPFVKANLPNVRFLVVGARDKDKEEKKRLLKISASQGTQEYILFVGETPNTEMPKYYNAADVSVLPSIVEATSISGLESMACGCPVIGTKVGGIPEIITHEEDGILVPPKDEKALACAIISLASNESLRQKLSRNSRKKVIKNFSWITIAARTIEVYENVLYP